MATSKPRALEKLEYDEAAQAYLASLTIEDIMEGEQQGQQRIITVSSLSQLGTECPEFHLYNEMLIQYRLKAGDPIRQVVPDNMVVVHDGELRLDTSFDIAFQPAAPFWVLEYVSRRTKRKDYEINFDRYEQDLKVPYYLLFYPDDEELSLYRRRQSKYVSVKPNRHGRLAIPKLELEMALLDGWVRFWFRGELLELPADLRQSNEVLRRENRNKDSELARQNARLADQEAEITRLREQIERLRGAG